MMKISSYSLLFLCVNSQEPIMKICSNPSLYIIYYILYAAKSAFTSKR